MTIGLIVLPSHVWYQRVPSVAENEKYPDKSSSGPMGGLMAGLDECGGDPSLASLGSDPLVLILKITQSIDTAGTAVHGKL